MTATTGAGGAPELLSSPAAPPEPPEALEPAALVEVDGLDVRFGSGPGQVYAVRDASLTLTAGRCLALVGESGSGKSALARALLGLAGPTATVTARRLRIHGEDALAFRPRDWLKVRGRRIGLVSQDALVALDPLRPIGREVAEPILAHRLLPRRAVEPAVHALLERVGIPDPAERAHSYVHQLSGGLRQRALIASALAAGPRVLLADEPTTALDASVQARVLDLLGQLRADGTGLLLISHDLGVVEALADQVAVMREGVIVETGPAAEVLSRPRHPYTIALLDAVPGRRRRLPVAGADTATAATAAGTADRSAAPDDRSTASGATLEAPPLLTVAGATKRFRGSRGNRRTAVDDVSFTLRAGETLGLVGESGSGKSTLAGLLLGLIDADGGEILLAGQPWSGLPERERRARRHLLQLVPQDPLSAFDPRWTVARVIGEALRTAGVERRDRHAHALTLLEQVGLSSVHLDRRPLALSGGQRQRVAIARALATRPRLLVCDEPVSALDVSVQAQVLALFRELTSSLGLATLFISHDLAVVREICSRVLVMKDGAIVETGPVEQVFADPRHPHTRELLAAVPGEIGRAYRARFEAGHHQRPPETGQPFFQQPSI
ncbi:ABC transporter ATP-binding protein [Frankia sp. Cpl3]|uniref:dipeptide ABC transporter ATP-binding protein n=1 Tax=Parafrankia colletiae TaxID=573497 RepID=UPI000A04B904|nr:ABC transporter ATP-binding protein [Parafrankia colletiae]MCK9900240.1 ABC transporter ATP-binding protein [Frankia sp. Cpl3]